MMLLACVILGKAILNWTSNWCTLPWGGPPLLLLAFFAKWPAVICGLSPHVLFLMQVCMCISVLLLSSHLGGQVGETL